MIKEIENILDEFDFHRVQQAMKALDWKYHDTEEDVTSIGELRRMARSMLMSAYSAVDSPEMTMGCGGFEATRYMYVGDPKKYLALKFVVTEWNNYD